jgi:NADPH:quinone reductase-like Zn-dependent oxidoreductase
MNAIVTTRRGNPVTPNVSFIVDAVDPVAGPGEAVVRTEASALNHLDLWVARGLPGVDTVYPFIGGSDGCGIVESVGSGVDPAWIGQRVLLNAAVVQPHRSVPGSWPAGEDISMIGEHTPGANAARFKAPISNVLEVGDTDPIEAAAFGLTHLTAWRMLVTRARLQAGQTVLVPGIGGGVAMACLSIARHFGCTVIVTSRHRAKLDRALELGANHAILDDGSDWSKQVRVVTGRRGVDIVAESVGKSIHMACIKSLARGGTLVTCGCTTGADATTDLARLFWNQQSIIGSTMGSMDEFRAVVSLLRSGALRPVVDAVFAPSQAQAAFARLEAGDQCGKVVIDWRVG